jgi:hypothetical protein
MMLQSQPNLLACPISHPTTISLLVMGKQSKSNNLRVSLFAREGEKRTRYVVVAHSPEKRWRHTFRVFLQHRRLLLCCCAAVLLCCPRYRGNNMKGKGRLRDWTGSAETGWRNRQLGITVDPAATVYTWCGMVTLVCGVVVVACCMSMQARQVPDGHPVTLRTQGVLPPRYSILHTHHASVGEVFRTYTCTCTVPYPQAER